MNAQERLRDAATAIAATVRDVSPLNLPGDLPDDVPEAARRRRLPAMPRARRRTRRGVPSPSRWLVPLAAAGAVVALAATLVAVRSVPHGQPYNPASPSASLSAPAAPASGAAGAIPGYFVVLNLLPHGAAAVGDTSSSRPVAIVGLPPGGNRFAGATGAADDRTFVLDVARNPPANMVSSLTPRVWYLLRIAPGTGRPARLARLPIPPTPDNTLVLGIALSPDGSRLAVLYQRLLGTASFVPGPITLQIFSVATGAALRTWTGPSDRTGPGETINSGYFDPNSTLTWMTGGRTLAFSYVTMSGGGGTWMLDLSRPGHDLTADSRLVPAPDFPSGCEGSPLVTADGQIAVCGTSASPTGGLGSCSAPGRDGIGGKPRFVEYSTVTGKLVRVLYRYPAICIDGYTFLYWVSPSGTALIGDLQVNPQFPGQYRDEAGLFTDGAFRPLQLRLGTSGSGTGYAF